VAKRSKLPAKSVAKTAVGIGSDLSRLEQILKLMDSHQISELEWENQGERLKLRTNTGVMASQMGNQMSNMMGNMAQAHFSQPASAANTMPRNEAPSGAALLGAAKPAAAGLPANQKQITSPLVGTFYRSPSPTAEPYCREGKSFKRGDVICIVEAMKLMNEIEAEFTGKIISILVENGQPVEFGEPLFIVET
jgi:acetyl-CoA carboxylase biotin carboxyl carrier protein